MRFYQRAALGAEAGLLAGAGVVLLFLVQDVFHLAPLSTPEALSSGLFGPEGYQYDTGLLAQASGLVGYGIRLVAYTLLHFLAFAVLGIGAAFVLSGTSWLGALTGGALYGVTACSAVFYGSRLVMDTPVLMESVGIPSILVANTVAGVILGGGLYLGRTTTGADPAEGTTQAA